MDVLVFVENAGHVVPFVEDASKIAERRKAVSLDFRR
jgi:hypothetical protein